MLDTTDLIILILVTLGTLAYFTKGKLWAKPAQLGYGYGAGAKTATANGIGKPKKTRNIVERMEQQNKNVVVFFGSQTGTAGTNNPTLADVPRPHTPDSNVSQSANFVF
jgi:NADPH-ferrihemoprotein reductase